MIKNFTIRVLVQFDDWRYNDYILNQEVYSNGEEIFVGDLVTRIKTVHDGFLRRI